MLELNIKYSFIIPVYNCEKYLVRCIEELSLLNRKDIQIVLVNDGSVDNSVTILDELQKKSELLTVIHQENQGVSIARNVGLSKACGEYIIFLDADDNIDVSQMQSLLSEIDKTDGVDMAIYGLSFDYYHHGKKYREDIILPPIEGLYAKADWINYIQNLYATNMLNPLWNKVIRRDIIVSNNLQLEKEMFLYEDLEYSLRCLTYCDRILFVSKCIYHYRQSEDEGNAGRRLLRIPHLPVLVNIIGKSLDGLLVSGEVNDWTEVRDEIVLRLYLLLASQKNAVSNCKEIIIVCEDFKEWINENSIGISQSLNEQVDELINFKIVKIVSQRLYVKLRHIIAVKMKYLKSICH